MSIADDVRNILLLEAFADEAKRLAAERRNQIAGAARAQLEKDGVAPSWTLPNVAKVTLAVTKQAAYVADMAKLTAWVAARHPEELEHAIRPSFVTQLLSNVAIEGEVGVDRSTGEIVPGIGVRLGGRPGNLSVRAEPGIKAELGVMVTQMLATTHPEITGPVEQPKAPDDPWLPTGDPFAAFPARGES